MTLSKNDIKYIRSLRLKKFRQKYNNFIVEGHKMVQEFLSTPDFEVEALYGLDSWIKTNKNALNLPPGQLFKVSITELERISNLSTPNQVLLIGKQPQMALDAELVRRQPCLYLDGIRDPGNLGTILRIADWFGFPYVFCTPDTVELYNPKVIQASMGAFLRVKCLPVELTTLIEACPEVPVYGADMAGDSVFDRELTPNGIIVIGNEGQGIQAANRPKITQWLKIPAHQDGGAESLNAAVATGIICAWFRKGG